MTSLSREFAIIVVPLVLGCGPGVADFTRDLGNGYSYVSADPLQKYVLAGNDYAVPNLVVDVAYDENFIVALRLVVQEYECEPGPILTEIVTPQIEYWIVEKKAERISGPLSRSDFEQRRHQLRLSDDLSLDEGKTQKYLARAKQLDRERRIRSGGCRPLASG